MNFREARVTSDAVRAASHLFLTRDPLGSAPPPGGAKSTASTAAGGFVPPQRVPASTGPSSAARSATPQMARAVRRATPTQTARGGVAVSGGGGVSALTPHPSAHRPQQPTASTRGPQTVGTRPGAAPTAISGIARSTPAASAPSARRVFDPLSADTGVGGGSSGGSRSLAPVRRIGSGGASSFPARTSRSSSQLDGPRSAVSSFPTATGGVGRPTAAPFSGDSAASGGTRSTAAVAWRQPLAPVDTSITPVAHRSDGYDYRTGDVVAQGTLSPTRGGSSSVQRGVSTSPGGTLSSTRRPSAMVIAAGVDWAKLDTVQMYGVCRELAMRETRGEADYIVDPRPRLTLDLTALSGSVFEAMARYVLLSSLGVNGTSSGDVRWIPSFLHPTSMSMPQRPCCSRLDGVNVFLSSKLATEQFVEESRVVASRAKTRAPVNVVIPCSHTRDRQMLHERHRSMAPHQSLVAYLNGTRTITLKVQMLHTLCRHMGPEAAFAITPETYIISPTRRSATSGGGQDQRQQWLRAISRDLAGANPLAHSVWIAKINHGAKGEGIRLIRCLDPVEATDALAGRKQRHLGAPARSGALLASVQGILDIIDTQHESHPWVMQRYIDRPMLIGGRKFDMRAWILVGPRMDVYIYKDGVCRMSGEQYRENAWNDEFMHVTNHCIQERGPNYGRHEAGNELSWEDFDRNVLRTLTRCPHTGEIVPVESSLAGAGGARTDGGDGRGTVPLTFERDVMPQMVNIIRHCFRSVTSELRLGAPGGGVSSFQFFGYDFIIDARCKVWLLEVNGTPGVAQHLLQNVVEDTVELTVHPTFPASRPKVPKARANRYERIMTPQDW